MYHSFIRDLLNRNTNITPKVIGNNSVLMNKYTNGLFEQFKEFRIYNVHQLAKQGTIQYTLHIYHVIPHTQEKNSNHNTHIEAHIYCTCIMRHIM